MFGLGGGEILLIAVVALLFIGPKKLPELARGLGRSLREFQKGKDDLNLEINDKTIRPKDDIPLEEKKDHQE